MRILFDSRQAMFKTPFGTLVPGQECTLHIHIPSSVQAIKTEALFFADAEASPALTVPFVFE